MDADPFDEIVSSIRLSCSDARIRANAVVGEQFRGSAPVGRPVGGNVGAEDPEFSTWLEARWAEYLTSTGFRWEFTPDDATSFAIVNADPDMPTVRLVVVPKAKPETVSRSLAFRDNLAACAGVMGPAEATCRGCERCQTSDWVLAVGTSPAMGGAELSVDRPDLDYWEWYRDDSAICLSGRGLRAGERMSILRCPLCGQMSFVPHDGWGRGPLHGCGHREPQLELPVLTGILSIWRDVSFRTSGPSTWRRDRQRSALPVTRSVCRQPVVDVDSPEAVERVEMLSRAVRQDLSLPFHRRFVSQAELGRVFGLGPLDVGKLLFELELRDGKSVTDQALRRGYAVEAEYPNGGTGYRWHKRRTTELIERRGLADRSDEGANAIWRLTFAESEQLLDAHTDRLALIQGEWGPRVIGELLEGLAVLEGGTGHSAVDRRYLAEWHAILQAPADEIIDILTDPSEFGDGLRIVSPLFAWRGID